MLCVVESITDVTVRSAELAAQLARDTGLARFPALFDLQGKLLSAELMTTHRGMRWKITHSDKVVLWFAPSQAKSHRVRVRHDAARGYYVGVVRARAQVAVVGVGCQQRVTLVRADDEVLAVIDNGTERKEENLPARKTGRQQHFAQLGTNGH